MCNDPLATASQLGELYPSGVSTAPKYVINASDLLMAADSEEDAALLLDYLRGQLSTRPVPPPGGKDAFGI